MRREGDLDLHTSNLIPHTSVPPRERSELSFFPITLHAPLSTDLLPAKRNWRDAVVLAAEGDWPAQADWLLSPSLSSLTSILSPLTSDPPRRRRERSELSTMFFLGSYQQPTTSNLQQFSRAHAPRKQGLYQERESVPSPVKVSPLPVLLARLQRDENFRSHEYTICRNLKKEKAFYF